MRRFQFSVFSIGRRWSSWSRGSVLRSEEEKKSMPALTVKQFLASISDLASLPKSLKDALSEEYSTLSRMVFANDGAILKSDCASGDLEAMHKEVGAYAGVVGVNNTPASREVRTSLMMVSYYARKRFDEENKSERSGKAKTGVGASEEVTQLLMDQEMGTGYSPTRSLLPHDDQVVEVGRLLIKLASCEIKAKYLTRGADTKRGTDTSLVLGVDKDNEIVAAPRSDEPEAADKLTYAVVGKNYQQLLRVYELFGGTSTEDADKIKNSSHGIGEDEEPMAASREACEMLMNNFWEAMQRYHPADLVEELVELHRELTEEMHNKSVNVDTAVKRLVKKNRYEVQDRVAKVMRSKRKGDALLDSDVTTPLSKSAKKALRNQQRQQQQQMQQQQMQMSSSGAGNEPFAFAVNKKEHRAKTDWCNDWNYRECSYGTSCRREHYCGHCYNLSNGTVKAPHPAKDCAIKKSQMNPAAVSTGGIQLPGMPPPNGGARRN